MVWSIVLFESDFQVLYEPRFRKCQSGDSWFASFPRQVWKEKMRVRNRKGATELLEANPQYVVLNPLEAKAKWRDLFGNDNPIHVEVGSGKGAMVLT
ncbi:tRNA (guanine-N(7)-)-methyltransferase [Streptococcus pneumoniae]|nr:tRNA (guanine-N(7)-)-methyltransferase [Streptococcus pneumoniae]